MINFQGFSLASPRTSPKNVCAVTAPQWRPTASVFPVAAAERLGGYKRNLMTPDSTHADWQWLHFGLTPPKKEPKIDKKGKNRESTALVWENDACMSWHHWCKGHVFVDIISFLERQTQRELQNSILGLSVEVGWYAATFLFQIQEPRNRAYCKFEFVSLQAVIGS